LDTDCLCGLRRLRELRCEENIVKTVGQLSGLVSLRCLHLAHNRMADLQEVEKLASIGGLAELTLVNNPVGRKQVRGLRIWGLLGAGRCYAADICAILDRCRMLLQVPVPFSAHCCTFLLVPACHMYADICTRGA
jgi:hypothetical protein